MKILEKAFLLISILGIGGIVFISFFNFYQTDDYAYAGYGQKLGAFRQSIDFYLNWGGRLWSFFVLGFIPLRFSDNPLFPALFPIFSLLVFWFLIFKNLQAYFGYTTKEALSKSLILVFLYFAMQMRIDETFYWVTGNVVYFYAEIFFLCFLLIYSKSVTKRNLFLRFLTYVLPILIIWSNEIEGMIFLIITAFLYLEKKNQQNRTILIISAVSFLITFFAPGNFVRYDGDSNLLKRLLFSAGMTPFTWITLTSKSFVIAILLFIIKDEKLAKVFENVSLKKMKRWSLVFLIPLLFVCYLGVVGGRTLSTLLPFMAIFLFLFFNKTQDKRITNYKPYKRIFLIGATLLLISPPLFIFPKRGDVVSLNFNYFNIYDDIFSGRLFGFKEEFNERLKLIKSTDEVEVFCPEIKNNPKALYYEELPTKEEGKNFVNNHFSAYYGKKFVWRITD